MSEVKRYDCTNGGSAHCYGCYTMSETDLGDYVSAEDYDALLAERDAILLQAQIWAGEAKTQKATVDDVGRVLGGVPDWGSIAAGVAQLKKDAERYRWLLESADLMHWENMLRFADLEGAESINQFIDAALQGEQP